MNSTPLGNAQHVRLVALWVCILFMGCSGQQASDESAAALISRDVIRLQLNWLPDAQHGGFYAALDQKHFADAGIDVEILPGGPGTPAIPKVATGRCDFAIGNADQVLLARQQGADVVAVFAAMQNSPRCIMVHEKSGIRSFGELENLTLALGDGKAFAEYLRRHVPLHNVRIVSYSGTVAKFLLDDNFAQQGYVFSEPLMAASQGGDPKSLMVSELGFNPYSSLLIARRETVEGNPELVRKVVAAVRAGWENYLMNPAPTNQNIIAANAEMDVTLLNQAAAAVKTLCTPDGFTGVLGEMQLERWETLRTQLIDLQLLPADTGQAADAFVGGF